MFFTSFLFYLKYKIIKIQKKNLTNSKLYQKEISNSSMLGPENESLKQILKISRMLVITNNYENLITGYGFGLQYFY